MSGWKILEIVSVIVFSSKSMSFGSMLSLVSTTGQMKLIRLGLTAEYPATRSKFHVAGYAVLRK